MVASAAIGYNFLARNLFLPKIILVNIYAPNDVTQQVVFLAIGDLSREFLIPYASDNLVLGGGFNCTISTLDQKGGRPIS